MAPPAGRSSLPWNDRTTGVPAWKNGFSPTADPGFHTSPHTQQRSSSMTVRPWSRRFRRSLLATGAAAALGVGVFTGTAQTSQAAASGPCDIYASGGTPCVAAHSTTRALYASYNGPLYQVRRASDNATRNIGVVSAGGYANAAAQDSFCAGTTCVITVIYDQSGRGNNL